VSRKPPSWNLTPLAYQLTTLDDLQRPQHGSERKEDRRVKLTGQFFNAFANAYAKARQPHDADTWREIWGINDTKRWSHHMVWQEQSVLRETASTLGLHIAPGEPLRLDAVFTDNPSSWHPIRVAVEHENDAGTIENEIRSLLAVRAPLKVGITYSLTDQKPQRVLDWLVNRVRALHAEYASVVGEDPATEYLILVGIEHPDRLFELDWASLTFAAGGGPEKASFELDRQFHRNG
jgi:hypothetical protein